MSGEKPEAEKIEEVVQDIEEQFEGEFDEDLTENLKRVSRNVEDSSEGVQEFLDELENGNINGKEDALTQLLRASPTNKTTGGVIGGALAGSFGGPIGAIIGGVVGGTTAYVLTRDGKSIIVIPVTESEMPAGADIHNVNQIEHVPDVRDCIKRVAESGEASKEASNLLRQIDFDQAKEELEGLGYTFSDEIDKYGGYFFEHSGQKVVVILDDSS